MANCIFTTGSVTQAMKAKRILAEYSIPVNTTKINSEKSSKGCVHGIEFNCNNAANIKHVLKIAGIAFEEFNSDLPG
ncbi:MAG: DUF3343 domain-containing protein [Ruminococcaceae bacterium]|nr:DUF3343 domain-containing protein [Oscillospiraceae bacterium]